MVKEIWKKFANYFEKEFLVHDWQTWNSNLTIELYKYNFDCDH